MSQFEAQLAMAPLVQGARRNLPVDIPSGTGIPAIQPANIGAPGVPGVAVLPAPVPDMSAARDLEQALRATQALGSTLIQTGNALNVQRQIDQRSRYQSREASDKAISKILLDAQGGKLNALIDQSDLDGFVELYANAYSNPDRSEPRKPGEPLTVDEADFRERVSKVTSQLYIARKTERQKLDFANDAKAVHTGLVDPTEAWPNRPAVEVEAEFTQRYPWMDHDTFMEAVYGKALEAVAKNGDRDGFNAVASLIERADDRTIYVDSLRRTLDSAATMRINGELGAASSALKKAQGSTAPIASRYAELRDTLENSVSDPGARESTQVDFLAGEIKANRSVGELNALDEIATRSLGPDGLAEYQRRKNASMKQVLEDHLQATAATGSPEFRQVIADAEGMVAPDVLEKARSAYVKSVQEQRKSALSTEYLKTQDRDSLETLLASSFDRYDPSKSQAEQIDGAIDGEEYLSLLDELDKVDKRIGDARMVGQIMSRQMAVESPRDERLQKVLDQTGAVANGHLGDVTAAASVVVNTQVVPEKLLNATYRDLAGSRADKERAIKFLAAVAPVLNDREAARNIIGWSMNAEDPSASPSVVRAAQAMIPMLSTLQRAEDSGLISDADAARAVEAFETDLERNQDAAPPMMDKLEFENLLVVNDISSIGGLSTLDPSSGKPTVAGVQNAVMQSAAAGLKKAGLGNNDAVALGQIAASRVIESMVPAYGNAGMSREAVETRVKGEVAALLEEYHTPKIDGVGVGASDKAFAPMARWDEAAFKAKAAELKVDTKAITQAWPVTGEGNSWCCIVTDRKQTRGGKIVEQTRFVTIDLPQQQAPAPMTQADMDKLIRDRVDAARKRAENQKPPANYGPKY